MLTPAAAVKIVIVLSPDVAVGVSEGGDMAVAVGAGVKVTTKVAVAVRPGLGVGESAGRAVVVAVGVAVAVGVNVAEADAAAIPTSSVGVCDTPRTNRKINPASKPNNNNVPNRRPQSPPSGSNSRR